ncbi:hypothetical protein IGI04_042206 [Brassica rapa subsp. trilocularis]|uniref:Uncharacterized protein n=1 Tax=Brassica rapa subsp. trilocularis TaxID=1813537 RepID=A0ABQ7KJU7_BRACM|nr:hypothetical protein IGI04_042206 [Brassica rapa subsp. trilocularis]
MESTKEWNHEPDHGELVAVEEPTLEEWSLVFIFFVFSRPCACTRLLLYILVVAPCISIHLFIKKPLFSLFFLLVELIECWCVISNFWCEYQGAFPQPLVSPFDPHTLRNLSTMAGDQNGKLTKEERLLLKSMNAHLQQMMDNNMGEFQKKLRQKFLQQTDDLRQKNKKRMDSQKLEPRSPDSTSSTSAGSFLNSPSLSPSAGWSMIISVQNKSSKHKWYKEEEAGRGQQSYKQTAHTSSRPHQAFRTPKSNIHSSYNQIVTKPQLYVFTGEGDYLKWERTMEKWLCYNKILKREALAYVMSQLKGNVSKWLLQEEDDHRYYKEPAITTWEDLKLLLRKKYASKGHTSLKSPKKKVISATDFKSEKSETKMADYEKEISSLVKEILKTSKHLDKHKKLPKNQEPVATVSKLNDAEPDSAAPIQEAQTKTSMGKGMFEKEQEFSLFLPHSESNFDNSFDELTCLEPVQPSRIVSVSQVAKEDSAEKEPESTTQEEQQKNLQTESAHESLSYDLQEHCKEFNMVASVPRMFVKVSTEDIKRFGLDKVKDFCVSKSVFDNMFKSFKELKPEIIFDQKRFQNQNNNISGHILSFDHFLKHGKSFDHFEKVLELELKQIDFCLKPCDSFARTEERSFVTNFHVHKLILDNSFVSAYVLNEPKKLQEPKLHQSDFRFKFRWMNHAVLCFGDILVYNTFFDMITHLTCPKQAEKGTGEEMGYNDQSIKNGSLAKLETQQANLGSCLAASLDIGAVRGSYLHHHKELISKIDCHGNLTHQGLTSNWNHVQSFSDERVMGSTSRLILCVLCLNFSEFKTSQSYLWRPESCVDYMEALKHEKTKNKREEDKRFKPPDLIQERHQDGALSLFSLYFRDLVHVQGVSRSLSAASCVTIRSTYLEKLESFDSFLQGLSHLFQSIILGSHHFG